MWEGEYLDLLHGGYIYPQLRHGLKGTPGNTWTQTLDWQGHDPEVSFDPGMGGGPGTGSPCREITAKERESGAWLLLVSSPCLRSCRPFLKRAGRPGTCFQSSAAAPRDLAATPERSRELTVGKCGSTLRLRDSTMNMQEGILR